VLSYPSGMSVSTRALSTLADLLRRHRAERSTRWRKLSAGRQALMVAAYLPQGETYADLACGFRIGTSRTMGWMPRKCTSAVRAFQALEVIIQCPRWIATVTSIHPGVDRPTEGTTASSGRRAAGWPASS
jgi:hypothetical protein